MRFNARQAEGSSARCWITPFRPLGASTKGRFEKIPLRSDATAMDRAVLVVVSLMGKPEDMYNMLDFQHCASKTC